MSARITSDPAADLRLQRDIESVCEFPRLVYELLVETGIENGCLGAIRTKASGYASLTRGSGRQALLAVSGDRFPPRPLYAVAMVSGR